MKLITYFQEVIHQVKKGLESYNVCTITGETLTSLAFQNKETKVGVRIEFLENESYQLMKKIPFALAASVTQRIRMSQTVMYEMNIRTKDRDYLVELDMYESEPDRDGRIDPAMYIRINQNEWKFYGVGDFLQDEQMKKEGLILLEACQELIAEMPIYRLRFTTGELEFGTEIKEQLLS